MDSCPSGLAVITAEEVVVEAGEVTVGAIGLALAPIAAAEDIVATDDGDGSKTGGNNRWQQHLRQHQHLRQQPTATVRRQPANSNSQDSQQVAPKDRTSFHSGDQCLRIF